MSLMLNVCNSLDMCSEKLAINAQRASQITDSMNDGKASLFDINTSMDITYLEIKLAESICGISSKIRQRRGEGKEVY